VSLRARLAIAFALFAAVPLAAALVPVARALTAALAEEHAARLDGAARAVEGELRRLSAAAAGAVRELARSAEAEALARDLASGAASPAEATGAAAAWASARGLPVLALAERDGRVVSSAHLPGRAGDVDPELAALLAEAPRGRAVPRLLSRAGADGVEPVLALVAWDLVEGADPPLAVAGGLPLGPEQAERLASLTGGAIAIATADGERRAEAAAPGEAPPPWHGALRRLAFVLGELAAPSRTVAIGPEAPPAARVEVALGSSGLARAQGTVVLAFLATLAAGTLAAAAAGTLLARRVVQPVDALRAAAARVAAGDLEARVDVAAGGEVGELVQAFNRMTADLARSRARLAQAERVAAWREVARRLAHEIKNPLTPIAMSVETLRDALAAGRPEFREIFAEGTAAISEEVRRLKRIVDEFSRFARLPAPEPSPIPAAELAQAVLALYPAAPAGVELVRDVPADLPAVRADRDQILQVLLNLVRNALDAMPAGGTLRVAARRDGDEVAFTVSDSGAGIAPGDLPRVFEPYFTTKEGGTGLGLAIAQRIVEEHGGRIDVASTPGEGATFTVRLPVAAPAARAAEGR
jgi:signal transduction histidine kinase